MARPKKSKSPPATLDDVAETVQYVENLLAKGEAQVEISAQKLRHPAKSTRHTSLAHCRVGDRFRIAILKEIATEELPWREENKTAWAESPQEEKLQAFSLLPQLLDKIRTIAQQTIIDVEQAEPMVWKILGTLPLAGAATDRQPGVVI